MGRKKRLYHPVMNLTLVGIIAHIFILESGVQCLDCSDNSLQLIYIRWVQTHRLCGSPGHLSNQSVCW